MFGVTHIGDDERITDIVFGIEDLILGSETAADFPEDIWATALRQGHWTNILLGR